MSRSSLFTSFRTLKPFKLSSPAHRFASTKSTAIRKSVYFGDVYWGKAWKDVGGTSLLYFPVTIAVMFWPIPIVPLMNRSKGIKKEKVKE